MSITVITISSNAEQYIEQTIQSVLGQTRRLEEYIVIDGGSTDGPLSIINRYKGQFTHVVSEKDEEIADAMNRGLAIACGDYVYFLHADDYFKNDGSLEEALAYLDETVDILACCI
jgi:glycosyltransferase involved in cell wall biosynthesis